MLTDSDSDFFFTFKNVLIFGIFYEKIDFIFYFTFFQFFVINVKLFHYSYYCCLVIIIFFLLIQLQDLTAIF